MGILLLMVAVVVAMGCRRSVQATGGASTVPTGPTAAQPRLDTLKVWLGSHELVAELALTSIQVQTGMMFRTNIAGNEAMLFVFGAPHRASFWMKNVPIPLSCAYLDSEGTILEIHDMQAHNEKPIPAGTDRVQFVLETAPGWFERNQVRTGMVVRTERGSLRETFFRRTGSR